MRLAVGIATSGRPEIVAETLRELAKQSRLPDELVMCPASGADVRTAQFSQLPFPVRCVTAPKGLPSQRNAILRALGGYDAVVFLDDDFFPATDYLAESERLLDEHGAAVVARGSLIADGIKGPGIAPEEARRLIEGSRAPEDNLVRPIYGAYGCNFAVRLAAVRRHGVRFDEDLPLYGWQEDIDFSRQLARFGEVVISNRLRGVHLGVKRGRTSGVRFGYSQVANPIYLIRKGTVTLGFGGRLVLRNVCANILRAARPEPWVDRRGRLKGNALAIADLFRGALDPRKIVLLD